MARKTKQDTIDMLQEQVKQLTYANSRQQDIITDLQEQIETSSTISKADYDALVRIVERQDKMLEQLQAQLEKKNDKIHILSTELDTLRLRTQKPKHNERNAGRKKNAHLEVYLLNCWAKEMRDCEIIGTEYDGFDGKQKVNAPTYYRYKRLLKGKKDM